MNYKDLMTNNIPFLRFSRMIVGAHIDSHHNFVGPIQATKQPLGIATLMSCNAIWNWTSLATPSNASRKSISTISTCEYFVPLLRKLRLLTEQQHTGPQHVIHSNHRDDSVACSSWSSFARCWKSRPNDIRLIKMLLSVLDKADAFISDALKYWLFIQFWQ